MTLSAVIILGHISLKIFDLVVSMTGPGPAFATDVPAFFMFDTTFRGNNFAQGAAIATLLLIVVAVLVVPYLRYTDTDGGRSMSATAAASSEPESRLRTATACRPRWSRVALYVALVIAALFYLMPVYMLLITGHEELPGGQPGAACGTCPPACTSTAICRPGSATPARALPGWRSNFLNSLMLAVPATLGSAILGSINGYVLAKWKFPGADLVFTLMLFGMFIPYQSILIPLVQTLQMMGLYGSLPGLIFVHIVYGIPITTLIFRNYYAAIPTELMEAAQDRRRGHPGHLPPHPVPDLDARLRRRHDLAVHVDLERLPLRRHRRPAGQASSRSPWR